MIQDDLGQPVELRTPPARVVSLVPSITEMLFALGVGDRCVGATQFCVYPADARGVPRVGGTKTAQLHAIRDCAPELVFVSVDENRRTDAEALASQGIPIFASHPRSVPDIESLVRRVGAVMDAPAPGDRLADAMRRDREAVEARVRDRPPLRVLSLIWKTPWLAAGPRTFMSDAVRRAGGLPVPAEGETDWPTLDDAAIARLAPEAVLLHDEPFRFTPDDAAAWAARGFRAWCADGQLTTWAGPRIGGGVRWMAERFHPEAFDGDRRERLSP